MLMNTKQDQESFDQLYLRNYDKLFHLANRVIGNAARFEELVQDTFFTYLCNRDKLRHHKNLDGWLFNTMRNLVRNEMRRLSRSELPFDQLTNVPVPPASIPFSLTLPSCLDEKERQLLIWYYEEQLTHEEIAQRLHISVTACRTRLHRARAHCAELLKKD